MANRLFIALASITLFSGVVLAEDAPRRAYPPMVERINQKLNELNLTPEQKQKTEPILNEAAEKIVKLRADSQGDMDDFRQHAATVFADVRAKLGGVLTPDQLEKLQQSLPRRMQGDTPQQPPPKMGMDMDGQAAEKSAISKTPATAPAVEKLVVGEPAPDFNLKRIDGKPYTLKNFRGQPTVLVFGSFTSPTFRARVMGFDELKRDYRSRGVNVAVIYTREAYAAGEWDIERNEDDQVKVTQPKTMEERIKFATQTREAAKFTLDVLVDDMDDSVAKAYDLMPNGCVILDANGNVAAKQKWADAFGARAIIDAVLRTK